MSKIELKWRRGLIIVGILLLITGCAGIPLPGIPFVDGIVKNTVQNITGKKERVWTVTQLQEANTAQALFEQAGIQRTNLARYTNEEITYGAIILPPQSITTLRLKTYCMDSGDPAPKGGEKMHLVPIQTLLDKDLLPVYRDLMAYSHHDKTHRSQIQRIVWNFRHVFENEQTNLQLREEDYQLLSEVSPGMTLTYYELKQQLKNKIQAQLDEAIQKTGIEEKSREALSDINAEIQRRYGKVGTVLKEIGINEQSLKTRIEAEMRRTFSDELLEMFEQQNIQLRTSGQSLTDANENIAQIVNLLESWTPVNLVTIPDDNSDYSLLQEGVGVHVSHNGGASVTQLTIKNTTDSPVTFDPANHAVESKRVTQRLAIGGIEEIEQQGSEPQENPSSKYYMAFVAHEASLEHHSPGHAFVKWIEINNEQMYSKVTAFGYYPEAVGLQELGEIRNEWLQKRGTFGDVTLYVPVTYEQYRKAEMLKDGWQGAADNNQINWTIGLVDCVTFTWTIAKTIGLDTPPPIATWPANYVEELLERNLDKHIPENQIYQESFPPSSTSE